MRVKKRIHITVSGRVQGVFFRASTRETAGKLGLLGWVRNLPDGRVEAVFEGEEGPLLSMLEWCRQGPPGALPDGIDFRWEEFRGEFQDVRILYR